jgi:hypothetical protein
MMKTGIGDAFQWERNYRRGSLSHGGLDRARSSALKVGTRSDSGYAKNTKAERTHYTPIDVHEVRELFNPDQLAVIFYDGLFLQGR